MLTVLLFATNLAILGLRCCWEWTDVGSLGVHNPRYAEKLLLDSIRSLTGETTGEASGRTGSDI